MNLTCFIACSFQATLSFEPHCAISSTAAECHSADRSLAMPDGAAQQIHLHTRLLDAMCMQPNMFAYACTAGIINTIAVVS
jgi:hypothetical protein